MNSKKNCSQFEHICKKYRNNMPHIVLNGKVDLQKIQDDFQPIFLKSDSIIRVKEMHVNSSKNNALYSTLVIDGSNQEFFIEVLSSDSKTTIRLFPLTDPEKTDSVKNAMVLICKSIKKLYPDIPIGKTNLKDYLLGMSVPC